MATQPKEFEAKTKKCFLDMGSCTIDRLYDPMAGQRGIRNICDFIGYKYPSIYYIECKTHKGKSISFCDISQYDKLCEKIDIPGVIAGVLVWFTELNSVYWIDIKFCKYVKDVIGSKSVGIRHLPLCTPDTGRMLKVPSVIKRVYPEMDLSVI